MSNEDILFLNYCVSLLTMLNLSKMKYINNIEITVTEMKFKGKYTDSYFFDGLTMPLDERYSHEAIETGLECNFRVFR